MEVLLSIKPIFAELIFSGKKKYEFRKTIFKNEDVKKIILYASAPVSKIVGEFEIDFILKNDIHSLWSETNSDAGITKKFFYDYFSNSEIGYAIKIKSIKKYKDPISLGFPPPQSFLYLKNTEDNINL